MTGPQTAQTTEGPAVPRLACWQRWSLGGAVLRGCGFAVLLALAVEAYLLFARGNVHEVLPGQVYRCSQPRGRLLDRLVNKYGIRTVINLRGACDDQPWYQDECRATQRLNLNQVDVSFSAGHLPPVPKVRRLIEVLENCEYPIVFHCFRGVDRTGMASAIALLLRSNASVPRARRQLDLRYLHLPWGRTGNLDRFFDLYEEWLAQRGWPHTRDRFRRWALQEYCPGPCRCRLEVIGPAGRPVVVKRGEPTAVTVRCHNTSIRPWRLHPSRNAGIHLTWALFTSPEMRLAQGFAGMFHATVAPGEFIDLTVALPSLALKGTFTLQLDMVEEQHCHFHQVGSEPLEWEIEVR